MFEFNSPLIKEVQSFPCLYNKQDEKYNDKCYKDECWQQIGIKLNKTSEECKVRWKHLRETFSRKCKRKSTGFGADYDGWPYFELLHFIKPFIQPRKIINYRSPVEPQISIKIEEIDSIFQDNQVIESTDSCSTINDGNVSPAEAQISFKIEEVDSVFQDNQIIESTDSYLAKTIMSLLGEIPFHNRDKARAELMQFTFSLKEKYVKIKEEIVTPEEDEIFFKKRRS